MKWLRRKRREGSDEARLRQMLDASFEGLLLHRHGKVVDANRALEELLGRNRADILDRHVLEFVAPDFVPQVKDVLHYSMPSTLEVEVERPDGSCLPVELHWRLVEYRSGRAVAVSVRDLTERRMAEERLDYLAHHDGLTGLPNRLLFNDRLSQALELTARTGDGLAVMCLDLDHFRQVNELLGHQVADRVLSQVANRLSATLRAIDTVARLDGDEFGVVQPLVATPEAAVNLARRLVACVAAPYQIDGRELTLGVSCGIALYPSDGTSASTLMRNANTALYYAKHDGRGAWRFFEPGMDQLLQHRLTLGQDLRGAIERDELELYYQPFYDCADGRLMGFEALMRWQHQTMGFLPPSEFIPLAESCGLIEALGAWALETACREAARMPGELIMSVNVSAAQFPSGTLPQLVADALHRTGLPARRLELEVTESVLIDQPERALGILQDLHDQGARLCLDDFGTGYSSLSYLRRFPFDKIKIDRSFVDALGTAADADAIVRAVIDLARALRMDVTAEGVQTVAQRQALHALGCHQMQGFLLGEPIAGGRAETLSARAPVATGARAGV